VVDWTGIDKYVWTGLGVEGESNSQEALKLIEVGRTNTWNDEMMTNCTVDERHCYEIGTLERSQCLMSDVPYKMGYDGLRHHKLGLGQYRAV